MRFLATLMAAGLSWAAAGCGGECATSGDCKADEVCTDKTCVKKVIPPPLMARDAGAQPDAAPAPDAFVISPDAAPAPDAAPVPDAMIFADAGPTDDASIQDASVDGGTTPTGIERVGLLQVSTTLTTTSTEMRVLSSFWEHPESGLIAMSSSPNATCVLTDRAGPRTRNRGFTGGDITVDGFLAAMSTSVLLRSSAPGVFVPTVPPMFFTMWPERQPALSYAIVAGAGAGSLGALNDTFASLPNGNPPLVSLPPDRNTPISIGAVLVEFRWTPQAMSGLTVVAELSDRTRNVVLRCEAPDSGAVLTMPQSARQDFAGRAITGPSTIEVRYERSKVVQVPLVGSALTVPTTIRHSVGIRYSTIP